MAPLAVNMSHHDAVTHLKVEVGETARRETGRLVDPSSPAFFGAVRAVMCDIDYVAALYAGWDGQQRRQIATRNKVVAFMREMLPLATGEHAYGRLAEHLYELYRVGTVHLRQPKIILSPGPPCSTQALTWALMYGREGTAEFRSRTYPLRHLSPITVSKQIGDFHEVTMLPVSIKALFDDFLAACDLYARLLEDEEQAGGNVFIDRWRSAADALASPELNDTLRW